jgi:hypothetical protein
MIRLQDFRYALRKMKKSPGSTVIVLVTLAAGIGVTTAIYAVLYSTVLAPLLYLHPEQLVMVWSNVKGTRNAVSAADFLRWERENTIFQALNAWTGHDVILARADHPEQVTQMRQPLVGSTCKGYVFFSEETSYLKKGRLATITK